MQCSRQLRHCWTKVRSNNPKGLPKNGYIFQKIQSLSMRVFIHELKCNILSPFSKQLAVLFHTMIGFPCVSTACMIACSYTIDVLSGQSGSREVKHYILLQGGYSKGEIEQVRGPSTWQWSGNGFQAHSGRVCKWDYLKVVVFPILKMADICF